MSKAESCLLWTHLILTSICLTLATAADNEQVKRWIQKHETLMMLVIDIDFKYEYVFHLVKSLHMDLKALNVE